MFNRFKNLKSNIRKVNVWTLNWVLLAIASPMMVMMYWSEIEVMITDKWVLGLAYLIPIAYLWDRIVLGFYEQETFTHFVLKFWSATWIGLLMGYVLVSTPFSARFDAPSGFAAIIVFWIMYRLLAEGNDG